MAKRKAKKPANSGVKYSLLFALVLVLLAFLLIFAKAPVEEGAEDVTGNLLKTGDHNPLDAPHGFEGTTIGSTESLAFCVDSDAVFNVIQQAGTPGYAEMVNVNLESIPGSMKYYDSCYKWRLAEVHCTEGNPDVQLIDCGYGYECVEEFFGEFGENDVRASCVKVN